MLSYIVEIPEQSLYLLAQLLHIHQQSELAGPIGSDTLSLLSVQTECVMLEHMKHKVFSREEYLAQSGQIKKEKNVVIIPPFKDLLYVPFENRDHINRPW